MGRLLQFRTLCLAALFLGASIFPLRASLTIFTGARLIDGNGQPPIENAVLVIDGDRIVAAGRIDPAPYTGKSGAEVVHCDGETIMPLPMDAIVCATRNAAQVVGDEKNRGTLEPGRRADFLLLAANPLDDIRNTTHLAAIYHGGKRIEPTFQEAAVK